MNELKLPPPSLPPPSWLERMVDALNANDRLDTLILVVMSLLGVVTAPWVIHHLYGWIGIAVAGAVLLLLVTVVGALMLFMWIIVELSKLWR
jgi:hypothetical protein